MEKRWNPFGRKLPLFLLLILYFKIKECDSLNPEARALLSFRNKVIKDPYGAFINWNPSDMDPCLWLGVQCMDGKVQLLDLSGYSLEGSLAPELGQLIHLRSLVLYKNSFSGFIPKEVEGLRMLQLLDLRYNNLSGTLPVEIGRMVSLKCLFLRGNKIFGGIPSELSKLNFCSDLQFDQSLASTGATGIECLNRKFRNGFERDKIHNDVENCCQYLPSSSLAVNNMQDVVEPIRRRLAEASFNLPAAHASSAIATLFEQGEPVTLRTGAFPASNKSPSLLINSPSSQHPQSREDQTQVQQPSSNGSSKSSHFFTVTIVSLVVASFLVMFFIIYRKRGQETTGHIKQWEDSFVGKMGLETKLDPKKTGLSSQLQKAFVVAGVPKLGRTELEAACEDFSNIINKLPGCIVYKGTLSSGVEVAVLSTAVSTFSDWSYRAEEAYRKKIDTLSKINHKNFVNLLGYCSEDEPFTRMMVFEYAPNGTLFEQLHTDETDALDWRTRMRIIMGVAYCLQHMHHDLNFPVPNLQSTTIVLTDDYAAKIAEIGFWTDIAAMSKIRDEEESVVLSDLRNGPDPEENIHSFGLLMLETISGKVPYNKEHGFLVNWAAEFLEHKKEISELADPKLESFEKNELNKIGVVVKECLNEDASQRPTMKDIVSKLREEIKITPQMTTPKLSPLWWAELEVSSMEAS